MKLSVYIAYDQIWKWLNFERSRSKVKVTARSQSSRLAEVCALPSPFLVIIVIVIIAIMFVRRVSVCPFVSMGGACSVITQRSALSAL